MFDEVEQDVEAFLRRQIRVVLLIGAVGVLEAAKDFRDLVHEDRITQPRGSRTEVQKYGGPRALPTLPGMEDVGDGVSRAPG